MAGQVQGDMPSCLNILKLRKSTGADIIVAERIEHCYPSIIIHKKLLFTIMVSHSYVSESFDVGIIIPVPKDKSGDLSSLDNDRPITLIPVFSKLFKLVLIDIYGYLIVSDDVQFGLKKNLVVLMRYLC